MSKQWVRQEIKKNEVAEAVDTGLDWVRNNQQAALAAGGALIAVLIIGGVLAARSMQRTSQAWEKLAIAQSYAYQGRPAEAQELLKALAAEFPGSTAELYGTVFTGDLLYRLGKYKEAADSYQRVLDHSGAKTLEPVALADLGLAWEAAGDCKTSSEINGRFLDAHADHYLAPQAHASLARCQNALGQAGSAKGTLERIALLYPDTPWAAWAQARLKR